MKIKISDLSGGKKKSEDLAIMGPHSHMVTNNLVELMSS